MIYDLGELTLRKHGTRETFYIVVDGDMFISTNYTNMSTHSKIGKINVFHNSSVERVVSKIITYLLDSKIITHENICGDILYSWSL